MIDKLVKIQAELKAPKNQTNAFGKYKYRSCEDIIEAVKPLLSEAGLLMTISDEVVMLGTRYYVKATVRLYHESLGDNHTGKFAETAAYAREEETKKGMDAAQITGAASSYARKYALNGMFAIDDTKDADSTNDHGKKLPESVKDNDEEEITKEDIPW
jgi:hypothetical protein